MDIKKIRNLKKYLDRDISTDVESPRFGKQLKKTLVSMFKKADKNRDGVLNYEEFSAVGTINKLIADAEEPEIRSERVGH